MPHPAAAIPTKKNTATFVRYPTSATWTRSVDHPWRSLVDVVRLVVVVGGAVGPLTSDLPLSLARNGISAEIERLEPRQAMLRLEERERVGVTEQAVR